MATDINDSNKGDEIFAVHPPDCLVCCLRILTPPTVQSDYMKTPDNPAKDESFFGPYGNSLHFESPDDCYPDNNLLKLQRKLRRMDNPEFERWIVQLYLRRAFTASSHYFSLPFTITKIDEKKQGYPDFSCQELGRSYGLEVTRSTTNEYQAAITAMKKGRKKFHLSYESENNWAKYVSASIIEKTKKLRANYSQNGYRDCDLLLYPYLPTMLGHEDLPRALKRLIKIIQNDPEMLYKSKPSFKRISIISEGWAILDILGTTPQFLSETSSTL